MKVSSFPIYYLLSTIYFIFVTTVLASNGAERKENESPKLKVKNYHMKAQRTRWDDKTGVLNAEGNVDIVLLLEDKTTAHVYCDEAQDNRVEATGRAKGNVRTLWQEVTILSNRTQWNMQQQEVEFFSDFDISRKPGHATHKDFMRGVLEMDFDTLKDKADNERRSLVTATEAKGVWTPR